MSERTAAQREAAGLDRLNRLPRRQAESAFLACCGSAEWARRMAARRPFRTAAELLAVSDAIWRSLRASDWLEAFAAHPPLGEPLPPAAPAAPPAITAKPGLAARWLEAEQAPLREADAEQRAALSAAGREYESRFGYRYVVCTAGRSAADLLADVGHRLPNVPEAELRVAAEEQRKTTRARLERLVRE